jgi:DNA-binding MarR family transcriptional regulator
MNACEPLGQVEFAVLGAVNQGVLRSRRGDGESYVLRDRLATDATLYDVLRLLEQDGLLRSRRNRSGRNYELTAAGRACLRSNRRLRSALIRLLARSG